MKTRVNWIIALLILSLGIALLTIGIRISEEREEFRKDLTRILYLHRIMTLSLKILSDAKDLETGQRGFLLTGNPSYLEPYQKSRKLVIAHLDMLLSASRRSPRILAETEADGQILAREISILNRTITVQETLGRQKALGIVLRGHGKKWMDKLRSSVDVILLSLNREIVFVESRAFRDRRKIDRELNILGPGAIGFFLIAIIVIFREIRKNNYLLTQLENESTHDELTGLPNRRFLLEWLHVAMVPGRNEPRPFCVLFLDLDHFKAVNDRLGHKTGDLLLKKASRRFQAALREEDFLVRIGGDEFVGVIMSEVSPSDLSIIKERIKDILNTPPLLPQDFPIPFGVSVGCARYPDDAQSPEELLQIADKHMYDDKANRPG